VTDRNKTGAMIEHFGRTKYADTSAERGFALCMAGIGYKVETPKPVTVRITPAVVAAMKASGFPEFDGDGELTLKPDHWLPDLSMYGYSDGVLHWTDTMRRKDKRLRHLLYHFTGHRVFGVDSDYLEDRAWWSLVQSEIRIFHSSSEPVRSLQR
jgi:hypothetical protein